MFISRLFGRRRNTTVVAHKLYTGLVDQARHPVFYAEQGVPDSLDGRFDMIVLHSFLILRRLREAGRADTSLDEQSVELQTKLQEILFSDMDQALRELGVGDMGVGKRIRDMAEAFFGRISAYEEALALKETSDPETAEKALREAIERNLFRGATPTPEQAAWFLGYIDSQSRHLAAIPTADLMAGKISFAAV